MNLALRQILTLIFIFAWIGQGAFGAEEKNSRHRSVFKGESADMVWSLNQGNPIELKRIADAYKTCLVEGGTTTWTLKSKLNPLAQGTVYNHFIRDFFEFEWAYVIDSSRFCGEGPRVQAHRMSHSVGRRPGYFSANSFCYQPWEFHNFSFHRIARLNEDKGIINNFRDFKARYSGRYYYLWIWQRTHRRYKKDRPLVFRYENPQAQWTGLYPIESHLTLNRSQTEYSAPYIEYSKVLSGPPRRLTQVRLVIPDKRIFDGPTDLVGGAAAKAGVKVDLAAYARCLRSHVNPGIIENSKTLLEDLGEWTNDRLKF